MRIDSVRSFKTQIASEFFASAQATDASYLSMGMGKRDDGEHVVAVRTDSDVVAAHVLNLARGEADVRIVPRIVGPRPPPEVSPLSAARLQGTVRPLEMGAQIGMANMGFVGTLGCFVRDAAGVLYILTNSHVAADEGRATLGHVIGQPFGTKPVGTLAKFIPFKPSGNRVDAALVKVDAGIESLSRFNGAIASNVVGARAIGPSDLGRSVWKIGRTTEARAGKITAVEVDDLPVGYDSGVLRFDDQIEVSGGLSTDFSAGGDSGSLILDDDGIALGLLFAGGRDSTGEDRTYGNPLTVVLEALGVTLAL